MSSRSGASPSVNFLRMIEATRPVMRAQSAPPRAVSNAGAPESFWHPGRALVSAGSAAHTLLMPRPRLESHLDDAPRAWRRGCDRPGCACDGEFRAPRSRHLLTEYFWFCLEHVREYN